MSHPTTCPKCAGEMEEGFIRDGTEGGWLVAHWIAGKPEMSRWLGLKLKGKKQCQMQTFRCTRCGYLESYARET